MFEVYLGGWNPQRDLRRGGGAVMHGLALDFLAVRGFAWVC